MRSEEVVVGNEKDGESDGAVEIVETASGAGMKFIGTIEALNDLFELAVFSTFGVLIGEADDSASFQGQGGALEQSGVVDGMGGGVIGGVAVADELDGGIFRQGSDGFFKCDKSMLSASVVGEMIGVDSAGVGADGEPSVIPSVSDLNVGFVTGDTMVERAFVKHIELMTQHGGGVGVVQDSLVGYRSLKDVFKHVGSHSRTKSI